MGTVGEATSIGTFFGGASAWFEITDAPNTSDPANTIAPPMAANGANLRRVGRAGLPNRCDGVVEADEIASACVLYA